MIFKKRRPLIGITKPESKKINFPFLALWFSIWLGGGRPRIISVNEDVNNLKIDGLMLGGGTDVFPGLFFKEPLKNYPYDRERDSIEIKLLKKADNENLPVFAICRGAQLMNVVNKGTLHLDISKVYDGADYPQNVLGYIFFRKKIYIEPGTLLEKIFKTRQLYVNSIHKQSIDRIGEGLIVSSREPNGIIQAIEKPNHPFYLGVQFHPERLIYRRSFRSFFHKFIGKTKNRGNQ